MTTDEQYLAALAASAEALAVALDADRTAPVPWCGDWKVQDVALHVGGLHHVIVGVVEGRPTATFSLFKTLQQPAVDDPALGPWLREGAAALVECLRAMPSDTECWTFWEPEQNIGFWKRRCAHEAFVHGWDAAHAAGTPTPVIDAEVAADGVDEYLDLFAGMMRSGGSPGTGETVHVHCTDTAGEWLIAFPKPGERALTREHAKGDVAFRGPAEGLVLFFWGRLSADQAGMEIIGDTALADRWFELVPAV